MNRKKTTTEVSEMLGLSHKYLLVYISRYPELRPVENVTGSWFWSDEEIQRLIEFRAGKRRRRGQSERR